jgi:hypothetical protein
MASIREYPRVWAGGTSNKVWKVFWREEGKQRSKTCYSVKSAKASKAQIEGKLAEGKKVDPLTPREGPFRRSEE